MNTFVAILLVAFIVLSMLRMIIALTDAKHDDEKSKSQEQRIAELQKRVYELEAKL